jgi:hypothetical protein
MLLGQVCITKLGNLESKKGRIIIIIINFRIFLNKSVFVSNIHVKIFFFIIISSYLEKQRDSHGWLT